MNKNTSLDMNEIKKRESASTKAPNDGGICSTGSSQGAERNNEALMIIRGLKQEEKDINAVIMAASVICASLIWCSGQDGLRAPRAKYLLDLLFSRVPQTNSLTSPRVAVPLIPHVPEPALAPSSSFGPSFGLAMGKCLLDHGSWLRSCRDIHGGSHQASDSELQGRHSTSRPAALGEKYIHKSPWMETRRLGTGPRRRMRCTDFSGFFSSYLSWRTLIASFALLVLRPSSRLSSVVCSTSLVTPNQP
ncbi:hypothetical protein EDB89DRAFT_121896 [Lactarius sanguifluus]|nr:hypothetical protein EDB89DRAFT_121896 [Lactarius sanguifluus]